MSVSKSIWSRYANQFFGGALATLSRRRKCISFDAAGEILEVRSLLTAGWATSMQSALVSDMEGDIAGNHYFTGSLISLAANFGSITLPSNSNSDLFVAKQDANGQFLWAVRAGNPLAGNDQSNGIAVDSSGDVFITGSFDGTSQFGALSLTSAGDTDAFVAKLDGSTGDFLWVRPLGGTANDGGNGIAVDPDGNVVVSGEFDRTSGSGGTTSDRPLIFVSKFAGDGTSLWTRSVSGAMQGSLFSIAIDSTGAIYAGGRFQGTADFSTGSLISTAYLPSSFGLPVDDGLVSKLDPDGNWIWARSLPGDSAEFVSDMIVGPDQQLYISGRFEGAANLDGNVIISAGFTDFYVAKVEAATGSVDWAQRMGGTDKELYGGDLAFDPQGNLNIVGTFRGTADFGPQSITTDGGIENAFISTLTPAGTFLATHRVVTGTFSGGINIVVPVGGLHIDAAGNTFVAGWFAGATVQAPQQSLTANKGGGYMIKLPPAAPTKFFVVNDASYDRTYQYANGGDLTIDDFSLNTGDTSPRGAACTAAGTTVWVADANRNVYVYSASGSQLGSWTAGTLQSTAQVEGITTNGTDVWIVDNRTDKVFKYTAAAGILSGSLNSSSSFKLNSSNSNAKGIVTDGTSIWVINDSTTDKVFKYSLTGTLLGSWTIDAANSSPTGLTIDPTNVSNIWTVDNGTKKIYQYTAAASRTSGSQSAAATFALAVGNTNPQDIADPPVQSRLLTTETSAVSGPASVASAFVASSVSSVPVPLLKKLKSELSVPDVSLSGLVTQSRDSADLNGQTSGLGRSKTSARKQLNSALSQADPLASSDITTGADLDDLFADWSTDPLQLLVSGAT